MLKYLFLAHRYLGIGLGLVMLLWCLSGFVMMYKPYPELNQQEKLLTQAPLDLEDCCAIPAGEALGQGDFDAFRIAMLEQAPVLHLQGADGALSTVDLRRGEVFAGVGAADAMIEARAYAARQGLPQAALMDTIHNDQWSVYGAYNPHRPLYKVSAGDAAGTQWYHSSRTGEILQVTTGDERFWGTLGAVIHWLYPTLLREKVRLWSQTVIWLTILGVFLTATGLYFGIKQYKTRKNGRKSPYRGFSLWHHYIGLAFGVLTLSWTFSGLFSMNPWGLLEGTGAGQEAQALRGAGIGWEELRPVLARLDDLTLPAGTVELRGEKLDGELFLFAVDAAASLTRYSAASLRPSPLPRRELRQLADRLTPAGDTPRAQLISAGDSYYYHHHERVTLPAYRVISAGTRYYLHPDSGAILSKVDAEKQWYRWLFYGMHRGDFTATLRSRPVWDIFMWSLLLGVTAVCFTGVVMGARRLLRKPARRSSARRETRLTPAPAMSNSTSLG